MNKIIKLIEVTASFLVALALTIGVALVAAIVMQGLK